MIRELLTSTALRALAGLGLVLWLASLLAGTLQAAMASGTIFHAGQ